MGYRYLEDWTMADVAFEAGGEDLDGLFRSALDALMNVMVSKLDSIAFTEDRHVELEACSVADLLHDFLQKALYYKDAEQLLVRADSLSITERDGRFHLEATLRGEAIDMHRHELVADVKAVTHHRFDVVRRGRRWLATAVLDV